MDEWENEKSEYSHFEQLVHVLRRDEAVNQDIRWAVLLDEVRADVEIKRGAFNARSMGETGNHPMSARRRMEAREGGHLA